MTRILRSTHVRLVATVLVAALALTALIGRDDEAGAIGSDVDVVYIADGRSFADALVGSVLAAMNNAPLLTVEGNPPGPDDGSIPADTAAELGRLDPIDQIRVFGGSVAVTDNVIEDLGDFTTPQGNVDRIAGDTRFETAAAIAQALPEKVKNADQLDGQDASAFASAGHRHVALFDSATADDPGQTSSTSYEDIPGVSTSVTIPSGHTGAIVGRFTAQAACSSGGTDGTCGVRIVLGDGTALDPSGDVAAAFDNSFTSDNIESHAIQRISGDLGAGTYTVKAQRRVTHSDVLFDMANAALTAEVKLSS